MTSQADIVIGLVWALMVGTVVGLFVYAGVMRRKHRRVE